MSYYAESANDSIFHIRDNASWADARVFGEIRGNLSMQCALGNNGMFECNSSANRYVTAVLL